MTHLHLHLNSRHLYLVLIQECRIDHVGDNSIDVMIVLEVMNESKFLYTAKHCIMCVVGM